MIDQVTVERITSTAQIVEVVQDFVSLRKRGVNFLGLCPFHNEKTPSFNVSPTRGIFKCFGCGKAGNSVTFLMEHEHLSYVDALRYLARKYHIEVVEKEFTPEEAERQNDRESMLGVTAFAAEYFATTLQSHPEGTAVGLSYFAERGFRKDTILKFELGYNPAGKDEFTRAALKKGYQMEFLTRTGLTIQREEWQVDRFAGRVIFPIHNLAGRVIGFGGRVMKAEKETAKYLNSPESDIYHKSQVVYGLFQAKRAITRDDKCYLVEGYTDVISMHQAGIENAVSSSGTSLTADQIRMIKRFTQNLTILYDGDPAGIKASLRGIDMVLEEGMNVKVLLLPPGEDPDSFARTHGSTAVLQFIAENEEDFIRFKVRLLMDDARHDPVRKASLVNDIIRSISVIPDPITRAVFVRECALLLEMPEERINSGVFSHRKQEAERKFQGRYAEQKVLTPPKTHPALRTPATEFEGIEKELIRLMLKFGNHPLEIEREGEETLVTSVSRLIIEEIAHDELYFSTPLYALVYDEIRNQMETGDGFNEDFFIYHPEPQISALTVSFLDDLPVLSRFWEKIQSVNETEEKNLLKAIPDFITSYKFLRVKALIVEAGENLKKAKSEEEINTILDHSNRLNQVKLILARQLSDRVM